MSEPFICPPEHKHVETYTCYKDHGCRCSPCVEKSRARHRNSGARRSVMVRLPGDVALKLDRLATSRGNSMGGFARDILMKVLDETEL